MEHTTVNLYNKFLNEWSEEWINFIKCNIVDVEYASVNMDLTRSPNVTLETIKNNPEINWHYPSLSLNKNINYKMVKENPEIEWSYYYLSYNTSMTWSSIKDDVYNKNFNHAWLSGHLFVNLETIKENSNVKWDFNILMKNESIPIEKLINFILENKVNNDVLSSYYIYDRNDVNFEMWKTLAEIQKSKNSNSFIPSFSYNPNLTFEIVKNNPEIEWNWNVISKHKNITWDIIKNNYDDYNWDLNSVLSNPNITWEIIQNDEKLKNIVFNTSNNNVHSKIMIGKSLSKNPNISWKIVEDNPEILWNIESLITNSMDNEREKYIRNKFQQWFKKSDLKRELMENVWHPKNFHKFKYFDSDVFGDIEDDDNDDIQCI